MVFVSAIVPFNKEKRYLKDCLDSLASQQLEDEEIILVLNGVEEDIDDIDEKMDFIISELNKELETLQPEVENAKKDGKISRKQTTYNKLNYINYHLH